MAGNHAYNIPDPADQWVSRTATKEEQLFDKLDATSVLQVVKRAMATEVERKAADEFHQVTVPMFRKMYPTYIDNDHNMRAMKHHWEIAYGVEIPSLEQLEESFLSLRDSKIVNLNAAAVAKEDAALIAQRTDELRNARKEAAFDEEKAYAMPMTELEGRCRGW